jgi:hypothetical protein
MTPSEDSIQRRGGLQLVRLRTLLDVVYAIVIWRCFFLMPRPAAMVHSFDDFQTYLIGNWMVLVSMLLGVLITIIYWVQSNTLTAGLEKTDFRHTALSIFQLFFLLFFLQSLRFGVEVGATTGTRVYESVTAALVGITGGWAWNYAAKKRRLLHHDVTDEEAKETSRRIVIEPATALFTIPFAFIGPGLWNLAWFVYPALVALWRRRNR